MLASIITKVHADHQYVYLTQSIPILSNQTEQDFEIIYIYTKPDGESSPERSRSLMVDITTMNTTVVPAEPESFRNGKFCHPAALNKAAAIANGKYLVMLSADAVPVGNRWLENLLKPLEEDDRVAGTFGPHTMRGGSSITNNPALLIDRIRIWRRYSKKENVTYKGMDRKPFFSGANSAWRRDLWEDHKADETLMAVEDHEWGLWALCRGYWLVYAAQAAVEHTHGEQSGYGLGSYVKRIKSFRNATREIQSRIEFQNGNCV